MSLKTSTSLFKSLLVAIVALAVKEATAGNYNYADVLGKSILFYEAQRTGALPSPNRIPWRGDSFLNDKGENGEGLTGGYFDAGDFVKFGFPMAGAMTLLAWGLLDHKAGYQAANNFNPGRAALKWGTDYLIKAHPTPNAFYFQVGDGVEDHNYWGRPEEWPSKKSRPTMKLTTNKPGSEVAGESAAAMAAASLALRTQDAAYADLLLTHAEQLYSFANNYRAKYSDSFPVVREYYNSYSGYGDELAWAAAWLYRATNKTSYKTDIDKHWNEFGLDERPSEASWDWKLAQFQVLMAKIDGSSKYVNAAKSFCDWVVDKVKKTPKGLAFISEWGVLRHTANAVFVCQQAASAGINQDKYNNFAKKQIDYMLGDAGRSFVVGFGNNPPQRPHHASSSCKDPPAPCDWDDFSKSEPNGHVLTGALVGGPDINDKYVDDREDYIGNEVTLDYNAGFQSALAGLVALQNQGTQGSIYLS